MLEEKKYQCIWNPKEDITVYELAKCIQYTMVKLYSIEDWDKLDESITRHFDVSMFNYGDMIRKQGEELKKLFEED